MPPPSISPAIAALLSGPLDTFEKLEVAMALQRAPALTLSLAELSRELQLPYELIERGVSELIAVRLAHSAGGLVRLTPPAVDAPAFAALRELYDQDRSTIARAASDLSMDKIRTMARRTFAEAFHTGRKKDDET